MMRTILTWLGLALSMSLPTVAMAVPNPDTAAVTILGAAGLAQAQENSCIAVWVPVADNMAIVGIKWYNNDGTAAFPEVLVQSGTPDYPVALPYATTVATDVAGLTGAWSVAEFSAAVGSTSGGLYVIFRVPDGARALADGAGGGPALGYTEAAEGYPGWMSSDGEDWSPMHPSYGFAVRPILVEGSAALTLKSGRTAGGTKGDGATVQSPASTVPTMTALRTAMPNPFNPQTTLAYSLKASGAVDLAIYNLRGERICQLVSEVKSAGEYTVTWRGRDDRGTKVASGVYLARFVAGDVVMTQRLALVQ